MSEWTFLTNHAHVLLMLVRDPSLRMRDLADAVGITERAVHRIVHDLTDDGFLTVEKIGRRNYYTVQADGHLRHPCEGSVPVAALLAILQSDVGERPEIRPQEVVGQG